MPAPTSPIEICRLALDAIGEKGKIASIEIPENKLEVLLARHYDVTRRALLREYMWNFARHQVTIARTGDGDGYYQDRFLLPSDCVKIIRFGSKYCKIQPGCYDLRERDLYVNPIPPNYLYTDGVSNGLRFDYIRDYTDVSKFDALFVKLFYLQLAADISYGLSLERNQVALMVEQVKLELPKAISVNSQENPPVRVMRSRWAEAHADYGPPGIYSTRDQLYWVLVW